VFLAAVGIDIVMTLCRRVYRSALTSRFKHGSTVHIDTVLFADTRVLNACNTFVAVDFDCRSASGT
jgi:hypothetical protein